jgi:hypothetical protein
MNAVGPRSKRQESGIQEFRLVGRGSARAVARDDPKARAVCFSHDSDGASLYRGLLISYRYSITARITRAVEDSVFRVDQDGSGMAHDVCVRLHDLNGVTSLL